MQLLRRGRGARRAQRGKLCSHERVVLALVLTHASRAPAPVLPENSIAPLNRNSPGSGISRPPPRRCETDRHRPAVDLCLPVWVSKTHPMPLIWDFPF